MVSTMWMKTAQYAYIDILKKSKGVIEQPYIDYDLDFNNR